jgi:hypothetical protein
MGGDMSGSNGHQLSAELIDGITEAVASPTDPRSRAEVIADLVHEVDEAVKWRNERHPGGEEEQSLAALVEAAAVHRHRMDEVDESDEDEDERAESTIVRETSDRARPAGSGPFVSGRDFQPLEASSDRVAAASTAPAPPS